MTDATQIREARLVAGLTQAKLAKRAGTSQSRLSSYENGMVTPNRSTKYRLLRATRRLPSEVVDEIRDDIIASATRSGLSNVRVFGSVARRDDNLDSDIDLLVTPNERTSLMDLSGFVEDVEDLSGFDVDVLSDRAVPAGSEILRQARSL